MSDRTAIDNLNSAAAITRAHLAGEDATVRLIMASTAPEDLIAGLISLVDLTADLLVTHAESDRDLNDVLDGILDVHVRKASEGTDFQV